MTYPEVIQYLESFINYEKIPAYPYKESLKLERIRDFLDIIGNPQTSLRCIHIAGTKGKGSTCAFISYILREAGYKVGLYTSPHLSDFRERTRILNPKSEIRNPKQIPNSTSCRASSTKWHSVRGKSKAQKLEYFEGMISQNELRELVERLKPSIEKYNKNYKYGPLSFFEVYTALAFVYFKEQKVDFAVLETGLGGRLDATNVVEPYVCAITPISYEHTQKLGNSLREIATEKARIIKRPASCVLRHRLIVISASQEEEAIGVIRNRCKEAGAKFYEVGKDIIYIKSETNPKSHLVPSTQHQMALGARQIQKFKIREIFSEYNNLKIRLLGEHQLINACVAVGVIEALKFYSIDVGIDSIRKGLYNTIWPGRCEIVSCNPLVVLDGAQNVASASALKKAIKENFQYKRLILVLGISCDKDIKGICHELNELADEVILTRANNPRASFPDTLAKYFNGKVVHRTGDIQEAKKKAKDIAGKEDLVLVTGSLFVVGEARELFCNIKEE